MSKQQACLLDIKHVEVSPFVSEPPCVDDRSCEFNNGSNFVLRREDVRRASREGDLNADLLGSEGSLEEAVGDVTLVIIVVVARFDCNDHASAIFSRSIS